MELTEQQRAELGVALNEADLLGIELDPDRRMASATFRVLTLAESGPAATASGTPSACSRRAPIACWISACGSTT